MTHSSNEQQGLGFAFFCWHSLKYPDHSENGTLRHHASQQTICRSEFRLREQLSALREVSDGT